MKTNELYDIVVIGSGFGSLFFIKKILDKKPNLKIALIEWGQKHDHSWQIENQKNSEISLKEAHDESKSSKPWNYTIGFGGGTNCWFGQTPRCIPSDFEMKSRFNLMDDWPFSYAEIESYYGEAEVIMSISGPQGIEKHSPRSNSYPLPPHNISSVDKVMMKNHPDFHFPIATARSPIQLPNRNKCCATSRCNLCPVDAKFTVFNGFRNLINNRNIDFYLGLEAREIICQGGVATGVLAKSNDGLFKKINCDLVVLGANGIQSPAILLRSNILHPKTGVGICEQLGYEFEVMLDGLDNFDGGTITTGLNYSLYNDHIDRSKYGASLLYFENRIKYGLRTEHNRWRQSLPLVATIEDVPGESNRVSISSTGKPVIEFSGFSDYALKGLEKLKNELGKILSGLPIEKIVNVGFRKTESHIQCSLRAGADKNKFPVDENCVHHNVRNLLVVGSSVMTTCPPANPSLTVAAISLRTADKLVS